MAGQQLSTSALLIGSAIYDDKRTTSDSGGGGRGKPTSQKRGIRPKKEKKGKSGPNDWAEGDLENMGKFMERMHIHVFDKFNYKEQDERNNYSLGKSEVLQKISEFFDQDDKTDFVLYYTGHGAQDGSWLFPVTRRSVDTPATQRPAGGGGGGGEGATDVQERGDGSYTMAAVQETQGGAATTATVDAEVHEDGGATPGSRSPSVTPPDDNELENAEETQHREKSPIEAREDTPEREQSLAPSDTSIVTLLVNDSILVQPPPAEKLNDFITFEDIVDVWDEKRHGRDDRRDRRLMMILDCCHSGRWVQKVNGEQAAWMDCDDNEEAAATPALSPAAQEAAAKARKFANRRDICIQAACRPSEKSMVSDDQGGSVFTKAFVSAHTKSLPEKFILMALDHLFVLNIVSIASSPIMDDFTPLSSVRAPFGGVQFLDSFDDIHTKHS